ncbi:MAG: 3-deoxy-D-manno-octulosonic acid transferase [Flavisolibacter sp.]|nr:3-deoxy-D-manno-octulosonic acid transferase [Flavisolibacter sp.]
MLTLYNQFIRLYFIGIRLASIWNKKAAAWINGRKSLFEDLEKAIGNEGRIIWMHCSSAGEFEQGKPLIESLKKEYPAYKILVSFFSPSGFDTAHNYQDADYITYLPLDTQKNAERFLRTVKPKLVIFVKYEFWYHHLNATAFLQIPLLLVSAVFRKEQVFFKSYGSFYRRMLLLFRDIFVQDEVSLLLLRENGISHATICGDTRFDRVTKLSSQFLAIDFIQNFIGDKNVIVAGSTWEGDEILLAAYAKENPQLKFIVAPHEMAPSHLSSLKNLFPVHILYSEYTTDASQQNAQTLIIDSIGLLSRLYKYATLTYVGGGFTKDGIHNILEAAVWGKPVVFGPNYKKYREAGELIDAAGGFSVSTEEEFKKLADHLLMNEDYLQATGNKAQNYIKKNTGATKKILQAIQEKRLLTRL